ncbi:MAG TPA: TRAP transporter small permease [Usitatibacter sp.]|nr:TRAP transporter small permease [Usitatibacter sp.]
MDAFIRGVREVSRVAGVAAALMIALGVLVICDMVVERYIFGRTTIWQIDVVTYAIVGATFIGSAYVLMYRGHVNVDIMPMWLRPRARFWLALFTTVVSMAFCVTLLVVTSRYWYEAYSENWRSNTVWRARLWIPYLAMPAGVGLLVLQYVAEFLSLVTGREPPFGIVDRKKAA